MEAVDALDQLSSEALHDLAVEQAIRRHDLGFFWQVLELRPAAQAAAGGLGEAVADITTLRGHVDELLDAGRGEIADVRPLYLEYLRSDE
jgi:hypothetical protein